MHYMDMPMDHHVWGAVQLLLLLPFILVVEHYQRHMPPKMANIFPNWKLIRFASSLIRQLYHFATDVDCVLLQLVGTDIVKILFKYWVSYKHLTFMIETFELLMISCGKFDLLFVN